MTDGLHPIREGAPEDRVFEAVQDERISRKTFLKGALGTAGGLGLAPLLAACGGGSSQGSASGNLRLL